MEVRYSSKHRTLIGQSKHLLRLFWWRTWKHESVASIVQHITNTYNQTKILKFELINNTNNNNDKGTTDKDSCKNTRRPG